MNALRERVDDIDKAGKAPCGHIAQQDRPLNEIFSHGCPPKANTQGTIARLVEDLETARHRDRLPSSDGVTEHLGEIFRHWRVDFTLQIYKCTHRFETGIPMRDILGMANGCEDNQETTEYINTGTEPALTVADRPR